MKIDPPNASSSQVMPMIRVILLDTGPLGLVAHPAGGEDARICKDWFQGELSAGNRVCIPAIADFEVRRELMRAGKRKGLQRLDELTRKLAYIPLLQETIQTAAELWADARRKGRPTASPEALDADCLLAAQARTLVSLNRTHRWVKFTRNEKAQGINVVIATTNIGHLERYANVIEIPRPLP
jgi:predicted nucleic acid-binding protein